jgi:hypothetical protein
MGLQDGRSAAAVEPVGSRKPDSVVQPKKLNQQNAKLSPEAQPPAAEEQRMDVSNGIESQTNTIGTTKTISDVHQIRSSTQNRRTTLSASTPSPDREMPNDTPAENVPSKSETKTFPPVQTVTVTATVDAEVAAKKTVNSNSKLIQNSSAAQPRKPRVIQWP